MLNQLPVVKVWSITVGKGLCSKHMCDVWVIWSSWHRVMLPLLGLGTQQLFLLPLLVGSALVSIQTVELQPSRVSCADCFLLLC